MKSYSKGKIPQIIFGSKKTNELIHYLLSSNVHKCLIVSDSRMIEHNISIEMLKMLDEAKIAYDWMIPAGYLCVGIGLIVMMFSKSLIGAYACAIIIGLATSLAHSTLYAKAAEFVPSHMVGVAMSIAWGIANIGSSLSAYILEFTASFLGETMMAQFIVGIIFSIFASALAILLYVKKICKKGVKINE